MSVKQLLSDNPYYLLVEECDVAQDLFVAGDATCSDLNVFGDINQLGGVISTPHEAVTLTVGGCFNPAITVSANCMVIGNLVSVKISDIGGIATDNSRMTLMSLPAAYSPSTTQLLTIYSITNFTASMSLCLINNVGTLFWYPTLDGSSNWFVGDDIAIPSQTLTFFK